MERDILTSSLESLKKELEKSRKKRNQYSEKLKNMDLNKTSQRSRVKARINLTCQCEELDRIEKKIDFVKTWIKEVEESNVMQKL